MAFRDRTSAGALLAAHLSQYCDDAEVVVLGLPRGGVPVAYEVAKSLHAPLDVFIVRKLGLPGQVELAMGAIASGGVTVLNDEVVRGLDISQRVLDSVIASEQRELDRREHEYRDGRPALSVEGRKVIIVDDGLATGSTMLAAARALRRLKPRRIVVAVPVGARSTCTQLQSDADEVVCAEAPEHFYAVGLWYHDFSQTTDQEVKRLLADAAHWDFSHASS